MQSSGIDLRQAYRPARLRTVRLFLTIALCSIVASCKLAVIVGEGGDVTSESGLMDCPHLNYCVNEITDSAFSETFTAHPRPGFEFIKWQEGAGFACGESTAPTCTVTLVGNPIANAIVSSFELGYVMPMFRDIGIDTDGDGIDDRVDEDDDNDGLLDVDDPCPTDPNPTCLDIPLADIVFGVNGRDWIQPDLFQGVTWAQMNAACPGGICLDDVGINGYRMEGWQWATVADFSALLNHYFGITLGPGGSQILLGFSFDQIFADGWRFDGASPPGGSMSGRLLDLPFSQVSGVSIDPFPSAGIGFSQLPESGGWFYRPSE